MLNEIAELSRSLSSRGIHTDNWHPWIQPFRRGEALVAELDSKGVCARVSLLSREEVSRLRNIAPDFHNSFPGFNLNCPLAKLQHSSRKPDSLWAEALELHSKIPLSYTTHDLSRLRRLLNDFPVKEILPRLEEDGPLLESSLALLRRLASSPIDPETFLHKVCLELVAAGQSGRIPQELVLAILYGQSNRKTLEREQWKTTLILDVADIERFRFRVADPAMAMKWSAHLFKSDSTAPGNLPSQPAFVCSLTGQSDAPMGDKMPSPNLPILGPTYLMSMNADIPCQTRYGRTSLDVFHAGRSSIQQLNDAIRFMTASHRRNKTWTGVPNSFKDQSDLLITYLEEEPDSDVPIIGLFADVEADGGLNLATYEARAEHIHNSLRGLEKRGRDLHIRVLALSRIDPGRKQVVFSACYSAKAIYQSRDNWLAGARNIPMIAIPFPKGKGKSAEWCTSYPPSPTEALISFKRQWIRAGQSSQPVPGVELGRMCALLLETDADRQAAWLLQRYLPMTVPLLIGIARFLSGRSKLKESARREALVVVAMYGILLYRQDRKKEIYMEDRDFLLGQFLQFADRLHKLYCIHERKGSIPPQLIGNASISTAMQSPSRAFDVLSHRMTVYLAWTDRYSGEQAGLVKWTRKELGRLASLLKGTDLRSRVSPNGRAELLLGYLGNRKEAGEQENIAI